MRAEIPRNIHINRHTNTDKLIAILRPTIGNEVARRLILSD